MREGRIILPSLSNDGKDLDALHTQVADALVAAFGGFTATQGYGGWHNKGETQYEDVVVYDVAADESGTMTNVLLDSIVDHIFRNSDQHSVYVRYPDGNVKVHPRSTVAATTQEAA